MKIDQDTFNKIVTFTMLIFFMVMYLLSFILMRPLDLAGILGFLVPVVTHTTHLLVGTKNATTTDNTTTGQKT